MVTDVRGEHLQVGPHATLYSALMCIEQSVNLAKSAATQEEKEVIDDLFTLLWNTLRAFVLIFGERGDLFLSHWAQKRDDVQRFSTTDAAFVAMIHAVHDITILTDENSIKRAIEQVATAYPNAKKYLAILTAKYEEVNHENG